MPKGYHQKVYLNLKSNDVSIPQPDTPREFSQFTVQFSSVWISAQNTITYNLELVEFLQ